MVRHTVRKERHTVIKIPAPQHVLSRAFGNAWGRRQESGTVNRAADLDGPRGWGLGGNFFHPLRLRQRTVPYCKIVYQDDRECSLLQ